MIVKLSRIEWVPVRYEYDIEVPNEDLFTIINKMDSLDEGKLSSDEANKIVESRRVLKSNDDFEAISEIDDVDFWEVNGRSVIDIEGELSE